jgi:AcrR family transcriptional regulator
MANNDPSDTTGLGLRERKKLMTRQAMLDTAEELFAERGFDNVTVAEIADRVNVAVKTVFVYFPAKEDLVFHGEGAMRDALVAAIRDREIGQNPLDAVVAFLLRILTSSKGPVTELERLQATIGDSAVLQSRMRLMWEHFEDAIAEQLAAETGEPVHAPRPRVAAAQIVVIYRTLASAEVREYILSHPKTQQRKAYRHWLNVAAQLVGDGLGDYAVREN